MKDGHYAFAVARIIDLETQTTIYYREGPNPHWTNSIVEATLFPMYSLAETVARVVCSLDPKEFKVVEAPSWRIAMEDNE